MTAEPDPGPLTGARWMPAVVFAVAALLAVLPLLVNGCSCGHDFDFHLLNWLEAAWQWRHGIAARPVWAFTPAYNAGEPRLLFYPPLSWATGALLTLLFKWKYVPVVFTWLVLFLCGLSMHRLLRRWTSPGVAVLGGCLYLVNPYMLFVAYERTAYAELMAAAWMPLAIAVMLRPRASVLRTALVAALLWLTNAPAAVVGSYSMLLLGLGRLVSRRREGLAAAWQDAARLAGGFALGLLLDAFYLLPMGLSRRLVQLELAVVPIARPDHNFLFHRDPDAFHTHVLLQASWIAVGTCAVAILCGGVLLLLRRRTAVGQVQPLRSVRAREIAETHRAPDGPAVATLLVTSAVLLFLLTPWSVALWHTLPELTFLQFPWRFLAMESALAIALWMLLLQRAVRSVRWPTLAAAGVLVAACAGWWGGGRYFREECADDETVQVQQEQFLRQDGVGVTDEYTPSEADNDALMPSLPPAYLATAADQRPAPSAPRVQATGVHTEAMRLQTPPLPSPMVLVVRQRAFPGWHTLLDGRAVAPQTRDDGLVVVALPAGSGHVVEERYRTPANQWEGLGVSAATLLGVAVWSAGRRRRSVMMKRPA